MSVLNVLRGVWQELVRRVDPCGVCLAVTWVIGILIDVNTGIDSSVVALGVVALSFAIIGWFTWRLDR